MLYYYYVEKGENIMKNSIRAILAMIAILPCALFFTACGGEKVEIAQAQQVYADAIENTTEITTDFKIVTTMKMEMKIDQGTVKSNITSTVKKSGEITEVDGVKNYDNVKLYTKIKGSASMGKATEKMDSEAILGKIDDNFYTVDKKNKTYVEADEYDIAELSGALTSILGESSVEMPISPSDFMEVDFESETMKVSAEKFGSDKYVVTVKGYEIVDYGMSQIKINGKAKITLKGGKLAEISLDFKIYTPKADADLSGDVVDPSLFTEQSMKIKCTMKVTYGKQSIDDMPASLEGYKKVADSLVIA